MPGVYKQWAGLLEWWNIGLGSFCFYFSFLKLLWLVFLLFLHSYTYRYTMVDTFKLKFRSWLLLIHKQKVSLLYHHTMNNLKDSVLCTGFTGFLQLPCRLKNSNTADFIGLSSSIINRLVHKLCGKLLNIFAHTIGETIG